MSSVEIARGALGLLSFIVLIAWLHWEGPWEDQKKDELPSVASQRIIGRTSEATIMEMTTPTSGSHRGMGVEIGAGLSSAEENRP